MKRSIVKKSLVLILMFAVVFALLLASACSGKITVTYNYNYDGAPKAHTEQIEKGETAEDLTATRDRYRFDGWFTTAACSSKFDFEDALEEDVTVYAGWTQQIALVTFDLGDNAKEEQRVNIGNAATQPANPTRTDYIFKFWSIDKDGTTEFDFSTAINKDLTIYAVWEQYSGSTVVLTYMWNYDGAPSNGVANTSTIASNTKTTAYAANRGENFYLEGWYTDKALATKFDFDKRVTANQTLYARWLDRTIYEGEYVNVTGLNGSGYSGGGQLVQRDVHDMNASNGFYLGDTYSPGLTFTFNINSDKQVGDAVMALRLSADYFDMTLTDEMFKITVNDQKVSYGSIALLGAKEYGSATKRVFTNHTITKTLALESGNNVIKLIINNNIKMMDSGTLNATAPLIDCMYLYSDATLTWEPVESNIIGK